MSALPNPLPDPLEEARAILLEAERQRLNRLEDATGQFQQQTRQNLQSLQAEALRLKDELAAAEGRLSAELDALRRAQSDLDALIVRLTPAISGMVADSIRNAPEAMAEALGPVMGEAIRVQIRDSRQEMVEAIYPIIGETIQKALAEFTRELQRNIDARFKASLGPLDFLRLAWGRLRGIPASRLALRDALPFAVREIFIVHRDSGLLIAHSHPEQAAVSDADLVSSMLTAIRDFVRDSYGNGQGQEELDEIQYGGQRIILVTGTQAYLAAVVDGVEPEGFRAALREFLSELHLRQGRALHEYDGNLNAFQQVVPLLGDLAQTFGSRGKPSAPPPISSAQKKLLAGGSLAVILLAALACFYLQFTLALLPTAFPKATSTPTVSQTPTPTATLTVIPTSSPSAIPTFTPAPTATSTATLTPAPPLGTVTTDVWAHSQPDETSPILDYILTGTPVEILEIRAEWLWVRWQTAAGVSAQGWIPAIWVTQP